jgi:hypothetical protein
MRRGRVIPARYLLPLASVALLAVTLAAPAPPAPQPDSVDEIVARHVAARGGLERIRSIQTLREKGRIIAGANREALVTRQLKRPRRTRLEFTLQGVTSVYVSDGARGWKMSPFDGDTGPNPLPEQVVTEAAEQADIEGPLVDWKAKGHQAELVGRAVIGGRETYKLKLTLKSGAVRHEYLDVESMYRVRTDSTRQVRGRPVQIETTFSDFKLTGGMPFPHAIEVVSPGRAKRLRVVVETIEVNPSLDDALFEMKDSAAPM